MAPLWLVQSVMGGSLRWKSETDFECVKDLCKICHTLTHGSVTSTEPSAHVLSSQALRPFTVCPVTKLYDHVHGHNRRNGTFSGSNICKSAQEQCYNGAVRFLEKPQRYQITSIHSTSGRSKQKRRYTPTYLGLLENIRPPRRLTLAVSLPSDIMTRSQTLTMTTSCVLLASPGTGRLACRK